jgi:hypothetical protein
MAFEFPSTITARKEKKKAEKKKLEKKLEKIMAPLGKKISQKGIKADISQNQFEEAVKGKEDILIKKVKEGKDSLKKIVDAATDDNQLGSTEENFLEMYLKVVEEQCINLEQEVVS